MAVLLVLFYHAGLGAPASGYLGVDIFFVVSGYLITRMVCSDLRAGTFSFSEFYFRRAKRLLPAAYVVLAACLVAAPWLLGAQELRDFATQFLGALTFTANFVLWNQTGYFAGEAELKPLLHFWSLAIEEQYYLLLPALLAFTPARYWRLGLAVVAVASLYVGYLASVAQPDDAFYLLPFRLWELGIGSAGALVVTGPRIANGIRLLFWPALVLLAALPFGDWPAYGRVPVTLAVCVATLIAILREHSAALDSRTVRSLAFVGDISYALYLVHWPLFAFLRNAYLATEVPLTWRLAVVVLSFWLAWALWRFVESPVRKAPAAARRKLILGVTAATLVLVSLGVYQATRAPQHDEFATRFAPNHGLHHYCGGGNVFRNHAECRTGDEPRMLLWGDSHAMHLAQALQVAPTRSFEQSTRSACPPFLGVMFSDERHSRTWAQSCMKFHRNVVAALPEMTSVEVVILSANLGPYADRRPGGTLTRNFVVQGEELVEKPANTETTLQALQKTVKAIRAAGKRVVWVTSPPRGFFNAGRCLERSETGLASLGANRQCTIPRNDYLRTTSNVLRFYSRIENELDVPVVWLEAVMCSETECITKVGDVFLYRDGGHLSIEGSRLLGEKLQLAELVWRAAR